MTHRRPSSARSPSPSSPWAAKAAACWPTGSSILAEHAGYLAQMTSVPGVAQRTGATNYYVELFPKTGAKSNTRAPVLGAHARAGRRRYRARLELMEAGRAVQRGLVTPDKTTFMIASTNRVYRDDREDRAGRRPRRSDGAAGRPASRRQSGSLPSTWRQLAEATGSVIWAVLFGALAGSRALPIRSARPSRPRSSAAAWA